MTEFKPRLTKPEKGNFCGESGIDGKFGNDTKKAADAFCTVNGVSPDNLITALGGEAI